MTALSTLIKLFKIKHRKRISCIIIAGRFGKAFRTTFQECRPNLHQFRFNQVCFDRFRLPFERPECFRGARGDADRRPLRTVPVQQQAADVRQKSVPGAAVPAQPPVYAARQLLRKMQLSYRLQAY